MGRRAGEDDDRAAGPRPRRAPGLPKDVRATLTPAVVRAWKLVASRLPAGVYLGGGTATAIHLHHRVSRDLDFFFHGGPIDLGTLERDLTAVGAVVIRRTPGTLQLQIGEAKVEFFNVDQVKPQHQLEPPELVAGIPVAGLKDLAAMKLKVLAERQTQPFAVPRRIALRNAVCPHEVVLHLLPP